MEFRKSLFLLFALVGSLVSHIVGGGSFISPSRLLIELALIAGAMLTLRGREYEGPALAFAILIVQGTAHFILGAGSASGAQMLLAHLFGGVVSYQFITHCDRIWTDITSLIESLLPRLPAGFSIPIPAEVSIFLESTQPRFSFAREEISRRGPPCN